MTEGFFIGDKMDLFETEIKEFDSRQKAKDLAEFITPQAIRNFLASKVQGNNLSVLEPAIGSGQLLFEMKERISSITGYDLNNEALDYAKANFSNIETFNQDFITAGINKKYDVTIANYPFSLKPSQEQKECIKNNDFLNQFYLNNVTGVLDFVFILKSFLHCNEGFYIAFPGIGYRKQEQKFREYLIKNKLIKEYGLIQNAKFDHTTISVLYLHLTKTPNQVVNSFSLDLETSELIDQQADLSGFTLKIPQKEIKKISIDPVETERQARQSIINNLKKEIEFSKLVYDLDKNLHELPSVQEWIENEIIPLLTNN